MKNKHSIGKMIVTLRKEKGWTQAELAQKLHVSDKAVSKWEKDGSLPSLEFFPALAELFGVSIDYLMTGKETENITEVTSKISMFAKKDDSSVLDKYSLDTVDEDGKSLFDYVKLYKSKKIITRAFNEMDLSRFAILCGADIQKRGNSFIVAFGELLYYSVLTNSVETLKRYINTTIRFINPSNQDTFQVCLEGLDKKDIDSAVFQKTFDLLCEDKEIKKTTYDALFSKWDNQIYYDNGIFGTTIWIMGLQELLDHAIKKGNRKLFETYYSFIKQFNRNSRKERSTTDMSYEKNVYGVTNKHNAEKKYPYITFKKESILYLLEKDFPQGKELNDFNKQYDGVIVLDYDVKMYRLRADKHVSKRELLKESCIHDGFVFIDELLATKDYDLIRETIKEYPVHPIEYIVKSFKAKRYSELQKYSEANGLRLLSGYILNGCKPLNPGYVDTGADPFIGDEIDFEIEHRFWNNRANIVNQKYFNIDDSNVGSINRIVEYIEHCKDQIIKKASYLCDKERTIAGLTKEYFEQELLKGNIEIVIIKLCVRLEAILRSDYQYEGDFSDMLNLYCLSFNIYDSESYNYDPQTPQILNKLRKCRNSIVHSEKDQEVMSVDEIKYCIDYICNMG